MSTLIRCSVRIAVTVSLLMGSNITGALADVPPGVEKQLRAAFPKTSIAEINTTPMTGLYEIVAGESVIYTDAKGENIFVGNLLNVKSNKNLTEEKLKTIKKTTKTLSIADLPLEGAVRSGKPGAKKLIVFSDLNCSWCRKLRPELDQLSGEFDIYEFLLPYQSSPEEIAAVWCAPDRLAAMREHMTSNTRNQPPAIKPTCDTSILERVAEIARKARVNGTPTLVREDGAMNPGHMPYEKLGRWASMQETVGQVQNNTVAKKE